MPDEFDVFLSHNSRDKPAVAEIAALLRGRGLRVWLDRDELRPGLPWQEGLEDGVRASRSVAVFVGKDGLGAWQEPEMRAFLARARREEIPVIPVLLPGCPESPRLSLFLEAMTWVDLRDGLTAEGLDRLVWGITGTKSQTAAPEPGRRPDRSNLPRASRRWWSWGIGLALLVVLAVATWLWLRPPQPAPHPSSPKSESAAVRTGDENRQEPDRPGLQQGDSPGAATTEPISLPTKPVLYAVRVQVLDSQGRPVSGSKISASVGSEVQELQNGWWEVEIPAAKVSADGQISIFAAHSEWEGNRVDLRLGEDPNPRAEIHLKVPESWIRGVVVDESGRGMANVPVFVQEGPPGNAITDSNGRFELKLSVSPEASVRVQAERKGLAPKAVFCLTGHDACSIVLEEP